MGVRGAPPPHGMVPASGAKLAPAMALGGDSSVGSDLAIIVEVDDLAVTFAPLDHAQPFVRIALSAEEDDPGFFPFELVVGHVGELELLTDDGVLLDAEFHRRAELAATRVRLDPDDGPKEEFGFRIRGTRPQQRVTLTGSGLDGLIADDRGQVAAHLRFWWVPELPSPSGRLDVSDLKAWLESRREAKRAEGEQQRTRANQRRAERVAEDYRDYVVNPYTFVGFPADDTIPERRAPRGHSVLADGHYSGTITATLRARTPLLIRSVTPGEQGFPRKPVGDKTVRFIPGSSLHGAIRSLHETLTGSCLRVFDHEFVPVYRDIATMGRLAGWRLGVVLEVDGDGRPARIARCKGVRWVNAEHLVQARLDRTVAAGQTYRLDAETVESRGRTIHTGTVEALATDAAGAQPDEWVALVTDPAARNRRHPYYCAVGQLPSLPDEVTLTGDAWDAYRRAVAGAKMHTDTEDEPEHHVESGPAMDSAAWRQQPHHEHQPIELRWYKPRPWFHVGQVVWIHGAGQQADGIKLSALWRTAARTAPAGDRIPAALRPCGGPELCPSCRMFGSADVSADTRRRAEQRSYRGHVRVADASLRGEVESISVTLPRQGQPRPGAGQFYLQSRPIRDSEGDIDSVPGRWGDFPDNTGARRLRGRKFYWHTDPARDATRQRWTAHAAGNGAPGHRDPHDDAPADARPAELLPPGAEFTVTLRFDVLEPAEIGALLVTLQPVRLLAGRLPAWTPDPDAQFAIHVGGGKPLGLGSCVVDDLVLAIDDAASRYTGAPGPALDPDACVHAFVTEYAQLAPVWTQAAAALQVDRVDSRIVSYPVPQRWGPDGACTGKPQHEHFKWFAEHNGQRLSATIRPYHPLPGVTDVPALPIGTTAPE